MQLSLLALIAFSGCHRANITVFKEHVNRFSLASEFVRSPDPRQNNPPTGEKLWIKWKIPSKFLQDKPTLIIHLLYRNLQTKEYAYSLTSRWGEVMVALLDEEYKMSKGILTYKAEIKTAQGKNLATYEQLLWTKLITIEPL